MSTDKSNEADSPIWDVVTTLSDALSAISDIVSTAREAIGKSELNPSAPPALQLELMLAREALLVGTLQEILKCGLKAQMDSLTLIRMIQGKGIE